MLKFIVKALKENRCPLLFTGIDGPKIGKAAVLDEGKAFGDTSLIPVSFSLEKSFPYVENGVLIERIISSPELVLCGGGHVSMQTAIVASLCNYSVTVIDEREDFANKDRFPSADRIINLPFSEAFDAIHPSNAYYVIVTRGHRDDRLCLEHILHLPYTYCGMIGSRTKVKIVFDYLLEHGYTKEMIESVHAPIGLPIKAVTPEEIAVSIVGEMIQVKNSGLSGVEWDLPLRNAIETLSEPYAMVTLVSKTGSAPRSTGARMIVTRDGTVISSIGGGLGEFDATKRARQLLSDNTAEAVRYTCQMTNFEAESAGMICGGTVDVLIQLMKG